MISGNEQFERDFEAFLKEDDSRLAALYRKLPQPEPDAKLDAAVLAMAHRTLNPHLVATPSINAAPRRRARWLAPLGAAAGLVLAAGVALRVGPQIWSERNTPAPAAMRDSGVIEVRPLDEAAPPAPASPPPPPAAEPTAAAPASSATLQARAMKPKAAPAPAREAIAEEAQRVATPTPTVSADRSEVDSKQLKKVENVASPPAPPQAFPGQGRRDEMDAVERKQAIATGAWQKLHENDAAGGAATGLVAPKAAAMRDNPAPAAPALGAAEAPQPATRAKATAAPAASASVTTAAQADSAAAPPEQEKYVETRHPAYSAELIRNSRLYPESWIAAIQRLVREGRRDEALQNLELFHEKYPNYRLPSDLKRLSAPQK
jgi:Meckel syndrome type 1 protein